MPHLIDYDYCLKIAKETVLEAAKDLFLPNYLKSIQDKQKQIDIKDGNTGNLVTETDRNIQKFIQTRLKVAFPTFKFMGEEEGDENVKEEDLGDEATWILDPIDGTTNFVHQFNFTVISLALCVDKKPVVGLIYCPTTEELFEAITGRGARLNGKLLEINAAGLDLTKSLVITEFGATGNGSEESVKVRMDQLKKLVRHGVHGIRMLGSAAFNLTRLTTNSAQIYFEQGIHAWDIASGVLLVQEAGGFFAELPKCPCEKGKFSVNGRSIVAAASRDIFDEFIKVLLK